VITPYQAQVLYLREQLPSKIEVMTTDSSQGSEKDIVVIYCVRANGSIGFLDEPSRMNVMLTRAKYGLYIFGNLTWLSQQDDYWRKLTDDAHKRRILRVVGEPIYTLPKRQAILSLFY
jgi:superfamily I DNA and/or RNA helicase